MDLITLSDAKIFLAIADSNTDHDALLKLLIGQYSAVIQGYCRRIFIEDSYEETYDGNGKQILLLNNYPIKSVESLTIDDISYDSDDYLIYADEGYIKLIDEVFTKDDQNVEIEYTAGYFDVPEGIKFSCVEMVAAKFKEIDSNRIGVSSQTFGDQTTTFRELEFTDKIKEILNRYRKPIV
jgi:hypothetical protein